MEKAQDTQSDENHAERHEHHRNQSPSDPASGPAQWLDGFLLGIGHNHLDDIRLGLTTHDAIVAALDEFCTGLGLQPPSTATWALDGPFGYVAIAAAKASHNGR